MNRTRLLLALLLVAMQVPAPVRATGHRPHVLDGLVFDVELVARGHINGDYSQLVFQAGSFDSSIHRRLGFGPAPYHFESKRGGLPGFYVKASVGGMIARWRGTIHGEFIEGSLEWLPPDGHRVLYFFTGHHVPEGPLFAGPDGRDVARVEAVPAHSSTLYGRLGGEDTIRAIVGTFVDRLLEDPIVNKKHDVRRADAGAHIVRFKDKLTQFLCWATGGPQLYSGAPLNVVHAGMNIGQPEWDRMGDILSLVLHKYGVAESERNDLINLVGTFRGNIVTRKPNLLDRARQLIDERREIRDRNAEKRALGLKP